MTDGFEMINHDFGLFIDVNGIEYPIVSYFDADGEECDKEHGVVAVAGCEGRWFDLVLSEFDLTEKDVMQ